MKAHLKESLSPTNDCEYGRGFCSRACDAAMLHTSSNEPKAPISADTMCAHVATSTILGPALRDAQHMPKLNRSHCGGHSRKVVAACSKASRGPGTRLPRDHGAPDPAPLEVQVERHTFLTCSSQAGSSCSGALIECNASTQGGIAQDQRATWALPPPRAAAAQQVPTEPCEPLWASLPLPSARSRRCGAGCSCRPGC